SSAAKKPWPVLIFSYCVVFTVSFSRGAVAVVHLAGGMKRADHQVPDELSSSFHHRLSGNVEGELLDRRERLPGDDGRPVPDTTSRRPAGWNRAGREKGSPAWPAAWPAPVAGTPSRTRVYRRPGDGAIHSEPAFQAGKEPGSRSSGMC